MSSRVFLAGMTIVVVLILIPPFNEILTTLIEDLLIDGLGFTGFNLAFWHMVPIVVFGYCLVVIPLQLLVSHRRGKDKPGGE